MGSCSNNSKTNSTALPPWLSPLAVQHHARCHAGRCVCKFVRVLGQALCALHRLRAMRVLCALCVVCVLRACMRALRCVHSVHCVRSVRACVRECGACGVCVRACMRAGGRAGVRTCVHPPARSCTRARAFGNRAATVAHVSNSCSTVALITAQLVRKHCVTMSTDMCIDMCIGMLVDMHVDTCTEVY